MSAFFGNKPWYNSRTILSLVTLFISRVLAFMGYTVGDTFAEDFAMLVNVLVDACVIAYAIYGRVIAEKTIGR